MKAISRFIDDNKSIGKNKKAKNTMKRNAMIFYVVMIALPVLQFLVFYVAVNINSIVLAFQKVTPTLNGEGTISYITSFARLENFQRFFTIELFSEKYSVAIINSLIYLAFSVVVVIPLGLIFSFYVYKKYAFSSIYRVFLFLPSVICSLVLVIFYQYIADRAIPEIVQKVANKEISGLLTTSKTAFVTLVFFNFWFSFGPSTLVYVNAMSGMSYSMIEAAEIDGATGLKQFLLVVLPTIFSSITSYIIICVAQVATNQLSGYSFFGNSASDLSVQTIGYNLFQAIADDYTGQAYPLASAIGILFTLILAPLTALLRWIFNKYGPKED